MGAQGDSFGPADARPSSGAVYVAGRASERERCGWPSVLRSCAYCDETVPVESAALAPADSCTSIVCSSATATAGAIIYIPPARDEDL